MQKDIVCSYLWSVRHPKADAIEKAKPKRMNIKWATQRNYTDCGIYTMRHMEVYRGRTRGFECGFDDDNVKQGLQIKNLRMRYATKIMLSIANNLRRSLLDDAKDANRKLKQFTGKKGKDVAVDSKLIKMLEVEFFEVVKGLEAISKKAEVKGKETDGKTGGTTKGDEKSKHVTFKHPVAS